MYFSRQSAVSWDDADTVCCRFLEAWQLCSAVWFGSYKPCADEEGRQWWYSLLFVLCPILGHKLKYLSMSSFDRLTCDPKQCYVRSLSPSRQSCSGSQVVLTDVLESKSWATNWPRVSGKLCRSEGSAAVADQCVQLGILARFSKSPSEIRSFQVMQKM